MQKLAQVKCEILLLNWNKLGLWLLTGLSSVFAHRINTITNLNPNPMCGSIHVPLSPSRNAQYVSTKQFKHLRLIYW